MPEVLYEEVIEVDERVVLRQDDCQLPGKDGKRIVTGAKPRNLQIVHKECNRLFIHCILLKHTSTVDLFDSFLRMSVISKKCM